MAIQKYKGHLALLGAAIMWGLMSPIGKTALENGISGLSLATFRMTGGAVCFWIASIFAPKDLSHRCFHRNNHRTDCNHDCFSHLFEGTGNRKESNRHLLRLHWGFNFDYE